MLRSHFIFIQHSDKLFKTSQLQNYLLSSYLRKLRFNDVGFWFVIVIYFVLLDNYVTLGLQKHIILIKSDIRQFLYFLAMYGKYVIITLLLVLSIYCIFSYVRIMLSMLLCFMTLGLRSFVVCCITYGNNVWNNIWKLRFVFVCHCDVFFFFFLSQLRYLFVRCSYFS